MAGLWGFESLPAPYVAKDRPGRTNDWIGSAVGNVGSALVAAWERNQLREEKKAEKQAQMELAKQKEAREQEQMKSLMGWRKAQAENLLSAREQAAQKAEMERRKEELAPYEGFAKTLPQEQEFAPLQAELEATRARHGQPERLEGPATEAGEVPMGTFTAREQVARMAQKRGPALETMQAREDAAKLRQKTAGRRPEKESATLLEKGTQSRMNRIGNEKRMWEMQLEMMNAEKDAILASKRDSPLRRRFEAKVKFYEDKIESLSQEERDLASGNPRLFPPIPGGTKTTSASSGIPSLLARPKPDDEERDTMGY